MAKSESEAATRKRIKEWLERHLGAPDVGFRVLEIRSDQKVGDARLDFVVTVGPPKDYVHLDKGVLLIEVKTRGEPSFLTQAIEPLKSLDKKAVVEKFAVKNEELVSSAVVAPFISERGRKLIKDNGLGYMDYAGNCSFSIGAWRIERTGKENPRHEARSARRLFAPKASRVTRALLEEPKRTWTVSELAKTTGLSLAHVHAVVRRLEENLYVYRDKDYKIALNKPAELLDAWADATRITDNEEHRYFTFQRGVTPFTKQVAAVAAKKRMEYSLTLHAGADLVAPFTRFNETHLYIHKNDLDRWVRELNLRPAEAGPNVHLVVPKDAGVFYRKREIDGRFVVCDTQLYVDLRHYAGRGEEAAQALREQKLKY